MLNTVGKKLVGAQGIPLQLHRTTTVQVNLQNEVFSTKVIVADQIATDLILGRDILRAHQCIIEMGKSNDVLRFKERGVANTIDSKKDANLNIHINVVLDSPLQVALHSEIEVMGRVPDSTNERTWIMEVQVKRSPVLVARAVVEPQNGRVTVRLLNTRDESVIIPKQTAIAEMELLPKGITTTVATVQDKHTPDADDSQRGTLWNLTNDAGDSLSTTEKVILFALLLEFSDLFAKGPDDFGRTGRIKHTINTGKAHPVRQMVRRIPPFCRDEARKLLKEMMEKDVIQPSVSPWASPIVLVQKKDGSTRFCVDYRKVNAVTRKDAYPLPRIDDTLDTLAGSKLFSTLDLISGYWQVEMNSDDQEKTAFCTLDGLFEFKVMPFGLCNAPATFQQLMDMVLTGLQWSSCLVYLDDVIVLGRNFAEHLRNLRDVFQHLREAGLKLKPNKCDLCLEEVEFLGHIVSAEGVRTDPKKTEKVAQWPKPTSRKEVQQFLGLANYYRRFVRNFASIAKPFHRLTEKTAKFEWSHECQVAFEELRRRLVTAPVLVFPDFTRPFILDTDASDIGIRAVLSQMQEDESERVIAYGSRVLTKPEHHYCVTRRELRREFILRTDHGSLTWLWNFKQPEGQLAHWLERLQEYNFKIYHRPGRKHQNADALSRGPCKQCGRESHDVDLVSSSQEFMTGTGQEERTVVMEKSNADLRQMQLEDGYIGLILQYLEKGEKPRLDDVRQQGPEAQRLLQLWNRQVLEEGVLKRKYDDTRRRSTWLQLVVPHTLREEVLEELHAGALEGHLGEEKTLYKVKERFYWSGMQQDVRDWCQTCETCATRKRAPKKNRAPLGTIKTGYPMQVVAVDILGPLPESEAGNSYVLVAGDYFAKWMEAYPIHNQEAATVARKLVDERFCRFSPPEQLHSDQRRQFELGLMKEICNILKIKKTRTSP